MAFDQRSAPPASTKQMSYLRALLKAAGHDDFRTARREYGLTQRQAGGKFTTREASALIDRLLGNEPQAGTEREGDRDGDREPERDRSAGLLRGLPADLLADELRRRGWSVSPPA